MKSQHTPEFQSVLPVLDLLGDVVVRGVSGQRADYKPIQSTLCKSPQPADVARAFLNAGFEDCYVADLNAICQQRLSNKAIASIAHTGLRIWLDAGRGPGCAAWPDDLAAHCERVVIGTETCSTKAALVRELRRWKERAVVSIDLCNGELVGSWPESPTPWDVAEFVYSQGGRRLIVLDLIQVGANAGVSTVELCQRIRATWPDVELVSGGGVRDWSDVRRLVDHGCNRVLVASALHDGRLTS